MKTHPAFALAAALASAVTLEAAAWQTVTAQGEPLARHECAFVAVGGKKLYLIGGRGNKPVNVYDVATNRWSDAAAPPLEIHHFQPVEFGGKIYVVGAMTGRYPRETPVPNILIFDPAANQWSEGPEIPVARRRGSAGVVVHGGKIFVAAGIKDGHWDGHVPWLDSFDPKTGQWSELPDAPHARDHFQAAVIGSRLYLAGGRRSLARTNETFTHTVGELDIYDFKSGKWSTAGQGIPTQRAGTYAIAWRGRLLVIGGESMAQREAFAAVEAFDPKTGQWASLPKLVQGRHGTGVAAAKSKLWIAAGSANRGGGPELTSLESYE